MDGRKTGPRAAYLPQLCEFLAGLILSAEAAFGRGVKPKPAGEQQKRSIFLALGEDREQQPRKSSRIVGQGITAGER